jgi:hypothetical protein
MSWNNRKSDRVQFQRAFPANLMGVDGTWRRGCELTRRVVHGRKANNGRNDRRSAGEGVLFGAVVDGAGVPALRAGLAGRYNRRRPFPSTPARSESLTTLLTMEKLSSIPIGHQKCSFVT